MRTYEHTHPWITFHWDARNLPRATWLLLGEASSLCSRISEAPVPAKEAELIGYIALLNGVVASAAMDGNTLSEDHLDRLLEGTLQLPPSQVYMGRELMNQVKAVQWTEARAEAQDTDLGAWVVQVMNAKLLHDLPLPSSTAPGEFRSVRLGRPDAVAPEDIAHLLERTGEWLGGPEFHTAQAEEQLPYAIIRALLAQLYLLWTEPFAEGNGRTARLLGHQLLLHAGIPAPAAHRMAMHAAATRSEHARQVRHAARPGGEVTAYLAYMIRGFAEQLRTLWAEVQNAQAEALVHAGMDLLVDPDRTDAGRRQLLLAKALLNHGQPLRTAQATRLDPELALRYARLSPKTLQRDLDHLAGLKLVVRKGRHLAPVAYPTRPFSPRRPA